MLKTPTVNVVVYVNVVVVIVDVVAIVMVVGFVAVYRRNEGTLYERFYMSVCPSVGWLVGRLVGWMVGP